MMPLSAFKENGKFISYAWPGGLDNMTTIEKVMNNIVMDENGCWLWTKAISKAGYATFHGGVKKLYVHRWIWEYYNDRIPDGFQIDHLCRVRHCVNPNHMEVVTSRENTMRGENFAAKNAVKTVCVQGHSYTPENTHIYQNGWRRCKECHRQNERARNRRRHETTVISR